MKNLNITMGPRNFTLWKVIVDDGELVLQRNIAQLPIYISITPNIHTQICIYISLSIHLISLAKPSPLSSLYTHTYRYDFRYSVKSFNSSLSDDFSYAFRVDYCRFIYTITFVFNSNRFDFDCKQVLTLY